VATTIQASPNKTLRPLRALLRPAPTTRPCYPRPSPPTSIPGRHCTTEGKRAVTEPPCACSTSMLARDRHGLGHSANRAARPQDSAASPAPYRWSAASPRQVSRAVRRTPHRRARGWGMEKGGGGEGEVRSVFDEVWRRCPSLCSVGPCPRMARAAQCAQSNGESFDLNSKSFTLSTDQ